MVESCQCLGNFREYRDSQRWEDVVEVEEEEEEKFRWGVIISYAYKVVKDNNSIYF